MADLFLWVVMVLLSATPVLHADDPVERDARVMDASGPVTLKTGDNPKQAIALDDETPLAEGDVIETGPQSKAEIIVNGETVITLQPASRLTFKKIFLRNTQLELSQGALVAKVKPAEQPDQTLLIKMPTAVIAIRGTEFGAETGGGVSQVGVFDEGHVVVAGAWGHEHVMLAPNQETKVTLSNVPQPPRPLSHFRTYKNQLPHIRARATYWRQKWKPLSPEQKQTIRKGISDPNRKTLGLFHHSAPPQPHPAKKTSKRKKHKVTHSSKKKTHHKKSLPKHPKAASDS